MEQVQELKQGRVLRNKKQRMNSTNPFVNPTVLLNVFELNSVLNLDPTHTTTLRNKFATDLTGRFRKLKADIKTSITTNDCFGLRTDRPFGLVGLATIPNRAFAFETDAKKVDGFMNWLNAEVDKGVLEVHYSQEGRRIVGHSNWSKVYIDSSYKKGMARAGTEMSKAGLIDPSKYPAQPMFSMEAMFNRPIHADRVGLLYTRTFNELKGITEAMDQQISRALAEGMAQGLGPAKIARNLTDRVDKIGITRARTMARTEIIRAHHLATINTYREAQIEGVRVKAEWSTAGFGVCPSCAEMEGKIFTLNEIEGMIPLHPSCRCCALPAGVGERKAPSEPKSSEYYERKLEETQAKIDKLNKQTATIEKQLLREDRARIAARKREGKAIAAKRLPPKPIPKPVGKN